MIEEAKQNIDLLEYIRSNTNGSFIRVGGNKHRLNPCPKCGHKDHFTIYTDTNSYSSFNGCCSGGSIVDYLMEVESMDQAEAIDKVKELYNGKSVPRTVPTKAPEKETPKKDYTKSILQLYANQTEKDKDYFRSRGLSDGTIEKYKLCIGSMGSWNERRAIIPTWEDGKVTYYTGRSLNDQNPKYKNDTGKAPIFGTGNLKDVAPGETVMITEGIFDALCLEEVGFKAISMHGLKHEVLTDTIKDHKAHFLTALDNDESGKNCSRNIEKSLGIKPLEIPKEFREIDKFDINDWFLESPENLKETINAAIDKHKSKGTIYEYLQKDFLNEFKDSREAPKILTGFDKLNDILNGGIYPGLYVIGAMSAVGKSALTLQIADFIAEQETDVLFFSLEMGRFEMVCRSLARELLKLDPKHANISTGHILNGNLKPEYLGNAVETYEKNISKNLFIIEGNFGLTVETIKEKIEESIRIKGKAPVVFVDYLQVIKPVDMKMQDKQAIDSNVVELKRMSRDYKTPVIVVSSFNRAAYGKKTDMSNFKESGSIEYTADVLLGMTLTEDTDPQNEPRQIDLTILKNRRGKSGETINLSYYPKHNYFEGV